MSERDLEHKGVPPIPAIFALLGIDRVKISDQFSLTYKSGILEAQVKYSSGQTVIARKYVKGNSFQQMTPFDPAEMTKDERNIAIKALYANTHTQAELATLFNLSQAMISRIVSA